MWATQIEGRLHLLISALFSVYSICSMQANDMDSVGSKQAMFHFLLDKQ